LWAYRYCCEEIPDHPVKPKACARAEDVLCKHDISHRTRHEEN
jgi:hypothetical protein